MKKVNKIIRQWVPRGVPAQSEGHQEILSKSVNIHHKKRQNQVVHGAVLMILGLSFFYLSNNLGSAAFWGLGIMSCTLVMWMFMEFWMIKRRKLPIDEALTHYRQQLINYYETKKYIYFIVAPLLLAAYIYGFAMLLSIFEQELLGEFYTYIIYSTLIVFLGLAVLIGIQLKEELEILKSLITDDKAS